MFGLKDRLVAMLAGGAAFMLLVALVMVTISKTATIHTLERQAKVLNTELKACNATVTALRGNQAALKQSIAAQNSAVERLEAKAAALHQAGLVERQRAAVAVTTANANAARLAARKAGPNMCASADALILEESK